MTIFRTYSECENKDIGNNNICIYAMRSNDTDELSNDSILYETFYCHLNESFFRCPCYISDKVIGLRYNQQKITDELDRELEERLESLQKENNML